MMKPLKYLMIICLFSFLFALTITSQNTVGLILNSENAIEGYTLFTVHTNTYLIDNNGKIVKQWKSDYSAGQSVYLLENGNLLRPAEIPSKSRFTMPSVGGRVELFDWDGNLIWEYNYSTPTKTQHHDVCPMPNGNILMLAIEVINQSEAVQMGRKLLTPPFKQLYNEQILELKPKGSNDADIVWEWNLKDHLVQDHDMTKDNYGIIKDNPQRIDVNYIGSSSGGANWIHINSVQYNAELDQIVLSSKHLSEIYIIDHSTTTALAATSSGGRYQKGGDILYRWGNPAVYKQGTVEDQELFGPHFPYWIGKGLKDAGKIIVFNNGTFREPEYSEVLIFEPPAGTPGYYNYKANTAYGPANPDYFYNAPVITDFYSPFKSSAQRLPQGHTFICEGESGHFFEINEQEKIVWEYISPIGSSGILSQGEDPTNEKNIVFRAIKYPANYKAFKGRDLTPGLPIEKPRR